MAACPTPVLRPLALHTFDNVWRWRTFWRGNILFVLCNTCWCHWVFLDIMAYSLILWRTFCCYGVLVDVMTYVLTSWLILRIFWRSQIAQLRLTHHWPNEDRNVGSTLTKSKFSNTLPTLCQRLECNIWCVNA